MTWLFAGKRRLTALYIIALSIVAGLSLLGQFLVQRQLGDQLSDSRVVNLAGRQRMLSQKLCKAALRLQVGTDASAGDPRQEIQAVLADFERGHQGLLRGDAELGLPGNNSAEVTSLFAELQPHFQALVDNGAALGRSDGTRVGNNTPAEAGSASPAQAARVAELLRHEQPFLRLMDELVFLYDREAHQRVDRLRTLEMVLLAVTLVVLLCEGFFIFRPAVRRIRDSLAALQKSADELHAAKDAAETASTAKSRFLAVVSHEIRTPLHAVLGLTELTLQTSLTEKQRHYLSTVKDSGESLLQLLDDTLDFAKIEAQRMELEEMPFELRASLATALEPLVFQARLKGLALSWNVDPDLPECLVGDWFRLRQIITNLIANAIKFTSRGGIGVELMLSGRRDDHPLLRCEVLDTGIGIPRDKQAAIFEAFSQADAGTTREYGGTGLGLTISSQLAAIMGGQVAFSSQPGIGSTFWFEVPLRCAPYHEQLAAQRSAERELVEWNDDDERSLSIAIVEDTAANQMILGDLLAQRGHQPRVFSHSRAFLAAAERERFDLVLMDVQLPECDGWETTRRFRAWEKSRGAAATPVVAVTASALPGDRQKCLEAGMSDFLAKPLRAAELWRIVAKWASTAARTRPNHESGDASSQAVEQRLPAPPLQTSDSSCATEEVLNRAAALERLEGNPRLWEQLARLCAAHGPDLIKATCAAWKAGNFELARGFAHKLQGMAAQLGAERLAALLHEFDVCLRPQNGPQPISVLERDWPQTLGEEWRALQKEVAAILSAQSCAELAGHGASAM